MTAGDLCAAICPVRRANGSTPGSGSLIKGTPVRVFQNQVLNALSDVAVDCREFNAVSVHVTVTGTSASADLTVEGASAAGGFTLTLTDVNATQTGVTSNLLFDVVVGTAFVKVRLANVSGTFKAGQGFTVTVIPYVSPGQTTVQATVD